jgi:organic hydroperoxide reductase OsmC/OhrA
MEERVIHPQLVWDRGAACTAQAASGRTLTIGLDGDWSPEQLLVAAVESSLMTEFMRLASESGIDVLGYVSAADVEFEPGDEERPAVIVRPCVVVGRDADREPVHRLLLQAFEESPVVRALGDEVSSDGEVVVVAPLPPC